MIHVDDEAAVHALPRINSQCLFHFCTLICVFSLLEVGLYLESVVSLSDRCTSQNISSTGSDFRVRSIILSGLKHVGKNDISSLLQNFNALSDIFRADDPSSHRYLAWVIESTVSNAGIVRPICTEVIVRHFALRLLGLAMKCKERQRLCIAYPSKAVRLRAKESS